MGADRSNYLAYEARLVGSPGGTRQGTLVLFWPGPPGQGVSAGCGGVLWPVLDGVTVLGGGPVDTNSVVIMVRPCPSSASLLKGCASPILTPWGPVGPGVRTSHRHLHPGQLQVRGIHN